MPAKKCILDEKKLCDDCGECDYCDLNPFKLCDNCGRCIGMNEEYRELKIDDMIIENKSSKSRISHESEEYPHHHCDEDDGCSCGHHHN